ncbi:MAG: hypothetical protein EZS28_045509, partial [Streblomastix strix]
MIKVLEWDIGHPLIPEVDLVTDVGDGGNTEVGNNEEGLIGSKIMKTNEEEAEDDKRGDRRDRDIAQFVETQEHGNSEENEVCPMKQQTIAIRTKVLGDNRKIKGILHFFVVMAVFTKGTKPSHPVSQWKRTESKIKKVTQIKQFTAQAKEEAEVEAKKEKLEKDKIAAEKEQAKLDKEKAAADKAKAEADAQKKADAEKAKAEADAKKAEADKAKADKAKAAKKEQDDHSQYSQPPLRTLCEK